MTNVFLVGRQAGMSLAASRATTRAWTPRVPSGLGWRYAGRVDTGKLPAFAWQHRHSMTQVLSSLVMADLPTGNGQGLQWHVSVVSRTGGEPSRPSDAQVALTRCAFDVFEGEIDNHHPGAAVHLWLPVDPAERVDCECKESEVQVVEADGYQWSNDPETCRGCDLERSLRAVGTDRPCSIHGGAR